MSRDIHLTAHVCEQMAEDLDRMVAVERAASRNEIIVKAIRHYLYGNSDVLRLMRPDSENTGQVEATRTVEIQPLTQKRVKQ